MNIRRAPRPESEYLTVRNDVVRDEALSYRARGILVALLSRPDDWRTDSTQLAREGKEGRDAIRAALDELVATGYMVKTKRRDEKGRWVTDTVIYDTPQRKTAGQGQDGKSGVGDSGVGVSGAIRTTDTNDRDEGTELNRGPQQAAAATEIEVPEAVDNASTGSVPYVDRRPGDEELFTSIIGDTMWSSGHRWKEGTYTAGAWYPVFRKLLLEKDPTRGGWPGRFLASLDETGQVDEYLATRGLERANA